MSAWRGVRAALAVAVSVSVGAGTAGCTLISAEPQAKHPHASPRSPLAAASTPPTATAAPPAGFTVPALPLGVIATGALTAPGGGADGTVTITNDGTTVTTTVSSRRLPVTPQLTVQLSPHSAATRCPADEYSFVLNPADGRTNAWTLPTWLFPIGPDFIRTVVVSRGDGTPGADGCVVEPLAIASLTWKVAQPTGVTIVDHGSRPGASGTTRLVGGHPSTYVVAPGDTVSDIAARFGISQDDLYYLNPYDGVLNPGDPSAAADLEYGAALNLMVSARGTPIG